MTSPRLTYRFGPLERRGILGPVRGGQALVLVAGMLMAVAALDQAPSTSGALAATTIFAVACGLALAPVGRRTLQEWAPIAISFAARRIGGRLTFRSPVPVIGIRRGRPGSHSDLATPGPLRGVRIIEAEYRDHAIGALSERSGRRLTAVLACRVVSFSLLDPEAQERRLARWGLVLSGAASTAIRRVQWVERTAPAQGDELARWLHAEHDGDKGLL